MSGVTRCSMWKRPFREVQALGDLSAFATLTPESSVRSNRQIYGGTLTFGNLETARNAGDIWKEYNAQKAVGKK